MNDFYTLSEAVNLLQNRVELTENVKLKMQKSVDFLHRYMEQAKAPVYGVNTGFGSLQNVVVSNEQLSQLQENLLITHAAGVGESLSNDLVAKMLWLKLLNMSKGHSAVRPVIFERLAYMYNHEVYPVVTAQGSLGASGDLAPLSQMVLPLIGKGNVRVNNEIVTASKWLKTVGFEPITLGPKEALALINGTQFMLAHAVKAYQEITQIKEMLPIIACASIDAFDCRMEPFSDPIHQVRPHKGQIQVAKEVREMLSDSQIAVKHKSQVQDQYSFRCIPQVHGASYDAFDHCFQVWETELNAVTDNPNVFEDENMVVSGGNFHGQPLALTLDYCAMAVAELANISERRTYLLVSGQRGLTPYLAEGAGLDSGYMIAQYTAASLVSQNKQLCTPASVDSIVSSNGQEDHVSMGANAATKLLKVIENTKNVLAIEWLCAVGGLKQRGEKSSSQIEKMRAEFAKMGSYNHQENPMQDIIAMAREFLWSAQ